MTEDPMNVIKLEGVRTFFFKVLGNSVFAVNR